MIRMEEQLCDGERGAGGLLGQQRIDVLAAVCGARVTVRERRHGDAHLAAGCDAYRCGVPRYGRFLVGGALGLHAVDELHELRGALQVAEERLALAETGRRVAAQREEAEDSGIQKLPDQARGPRIGVADAGEMGEGLDVGVRADVAQHLQRAPAGGASGAIGDREEIGSGRRESVDRLVQRRCAGR
ncbi:hypothetical protein GCM10025863_04000 [Microbacterium suwonense]|uniref:Uncharacterized protein n=1 Tax=Microbacterium suwonense TaxID=683047 RepID=A0ABM8FQS5_9MICO|nr:hypothetical protein GCM10025863_04000 [Microbacterium suwonense]